MLSLEQQILPIWDTDIVYEESAAMVENDNGEFEAPLLYNPIEILKVCDMSGKICYTEGTDWLIDGNIIRRISGSSMPGFKKSELISEKPFSEGCFPFTDGYIRYSEGSFFQEHQIRVTYRCRRGEWKGCKPVFAGNKLKTTFSKLINGENLRIVAFGDSITAGANASRKVKEPYQLAYPELLYEALSRRYSGGIHFVNTAIGGKDTCWGIEAVKPMVINYFPDLVILAFGMNDGGKTPEQFGSNTRKMIELIRGELPKTEFILVATSTPNPMLTDERAKFSGNQPLFKAELDKISDEFDGIAVADITGMQRELHSHKRFIDTTGNNVNHPNDFFHRLYAQYLFGMLNAPENNKSC